MTREEKFEIEMNKLGFEKARRPVNGWVNYAADIFVEVMQNILEPSIIHFEIKQYLGLKSCVVKGEKVLFDTIKEILIGSNSTPLEKETDDAQD